MELEKLDKIIDKLLHNITVILESESVVSRDNSQAILNLCAAMEAILRVKEESENSDDEKTALSASDILHRPLVWQSKLLRGMDGIQPTQQRDGSNS